MYLEIQTAIDDYAKSIVCDEKVENGALVKVDGLADIRVAGVKGDRETFKGVNLTDEIGDLYAVVAPDVTLDQRYTTFGKIENDLTVAENEPSRCYFTHKGLRLRIEKALVNETVAVGDKLAPNPSSKQYKKVTAGEKNIIATVLAAYKYRGRDCYEILFL